MRHAQIFQYKLEMDTGVILSNMHLTHREGLILVLKDGEKIGYGEISPLPGFSQESLEDAFSQLKEQTLSWINNRLDQQISSFPSVAFGLSMAQLTLEDKLKETDKIQVATLCSGDPDALLPVLDSPSNALIAKMKVGLYEPIRDAMLVNLFLESLPNLHLRLDANRQWSLTKALKFASSINANFYDRIDFIEEPCQTLTDSLAFSEQTKLAIAWDESLQEAVRENKLDLLIESAALAKTWVIKPSLIGSYQTCEALIEKARQAQIDCVLSAGLESSLGLNQLRHMSAALTPDQIPGLDTLQLFKQQLEIPWPNSQLPIVSLQTQNLIWEA